METNYFFRIMYQAISDFYLQIDLGNSPDIAYGKAIEYSKYRTDLDRFIYTIAIAERFTMTGAYKFSDAIVEDIIECYNFYRSFNKNELQFLDEEYKVIDGIFLDVLLVLERTKGIHLE